MSMIWKFFRWSKQQIVLSTAQECVVLFIMLVSIIYRSLFVRIYWARLHFTFVLEMMFNPLKWIAMGYYDDEETYDQYNGTYVQDVEGWSDQMINEALDGEPDAYWNID